MNERIKELAEQAGFIGESMYPIFGTSQETALKNFAELIVQECLLAISKTPVEDNEIPTMVKCHDQVEKHFGVEE